MEDSGKATGLDIESDSPAGSAGIHAPGHDEEGAGLQSGTARRTTRREQLEKRLNEVVAENKRNRQIARKQSGVLQFAPSCNNLGVAKVDLAYKAVQDGIYRSEDGRLVAKVDGGEVPAKEYLAGFVADNPEFLPARISGGSGMTQQLQGPAIPSAIDIDKIGPSMDKAELERVRQEILRVASQTCKSCK